MDVIAPGQKPTITLKATDGQFKGFMVQAREDVEQEEINVLGTFDTEEANYLTCNKGIHNTITHRNNEDKNQVTAEWVATKKDFDGQLFFRFSVLREYHEYWVGAESRRIRVSSDLTTTTTTTTTTSTTTAAPVPTTQEATASGIGNDDIVIFPNNTETRKNVIVDNVSFPKENQDEEVEGSTYFPVNGSEASADLSESTTTTTTTTTSTTTT